MHVEIGPDRVLFTPARQTSDGLEYATTQTDGGETAVAYTDHEDVTVVDEVWLRVRAGDLVHDLEAQGVVRLVIDPS